jgi:glycosyltransferase involved in cell wall biosynthesis
MDPSFDLLNYSIAFSRPRRLTDVTSWHLHIPFAFAMIAMLRPKRFVELGTHKGDSYCAFCQAVEKLSLPTVCHAVDCWQGDAHAGFYGTEVLDELRAYHDPLYGGFSTLLQSLFDDALGYFPEASIDLLHIDGHHSYDSVRHDFEAWLPKMSSRGVVLFHDTNVRERGFGVWRLWKEISEKYPGFEFTFGNGLGVLAVGRQMAAEVQAFLEYGKEHQTGVSRFFYHLGVRIQLGIERDNLSRQVSRQENTLLAQDKALHQADEWLKEHVAIIEEKDRQLREMQFLFDEKSRQLEVIHASKGWRILERYRKARALLTDVLQEKPEPETMQEKQATGTYHALVKKPLQQNRPKIIHAIANVWTGGSSRLVVDLIEHLGHKYDQEVVTYSIPAPPAYDGFGCHDFSRLSSPDAMAAFLREKDAKILHVHYWGEDNKPWYANVFGAADIYSCPVIENINTPVDPYRHDKISQYVYVSKYIQDFFQPVPGGSCVIYPGSDLELFGRGDADFPDDAVGMVYRLERDKLNEDSIDALIDVARQRPATKVFIIGGGTFLKTYQEKVKAAGVTDNFIFTGYVPYASLPDYYRKFSLFAAPVWKESFGQVSTFAMSMALPVVGYDVGGLSEMLGSRAFLANDRAALAGIIIDLLEHRERRIEVGLSNRERAHALFTVETMADQYDRLYERLL